MGMDNHVQQGHLNDFIKSNVFVLFVIIVYQCCLIYKCHVLQNECMRPRCDLKLISFFVYFMGQRSNVYA